MASLDAGSSAAAGAIVPVAEDFDLDAVIGEVMDDSQTADLEGIARLVLARVPATEWREVLLRPMREYVRTFSTRQRLHVFRAIGGEANGEGGHRDVPNPRPGRSMKVDGMRLLLADPVYVDGHRKLFGDCTRDDVLKIAQRHADLVEQNAAKRAFHQRLARAMSRLGVERVRDLPESEILRARKVKV